MHHYLATGAAVVALSFSFAANAQINDLPLTEKWAPSEWGPDDKIGSPNRTTPAMVLKAVGLVKQGRTATLGKLYQSEVPLFGPRTFQMSIPGTPTGGPFAKNALVYHDEMLTTEIGQVSTQFDGPGHIGVNTSEGMFFYNGRDPLKTYSRGAGGRVLGMGDLGVEFVAEVGFVCRGILLNAAKYKGVDALPIPFELGSPGVVTADDIKGMMSAQGLSPIEEGDCVFLYTGHGDIWANSKWPTMSTEERAAARDAFNAGEPGFGVGACEYMASLKIILTGGDTSANDAQPVGDEEGYAVPCHTEMQTKRGIWNIENLDFSPLIEAGVYEFLFAWAPLKIVGATGSPGNPVVVW
ncbi:MAG: cyclase family protein [Alphaproteobacteria bacterium]